jgi:Amt family ammonium transporter
MRDYAGGATIHTLGAAVGLVGAWIVGPRLGRYAPDGRPRPLAGHSLALAALGVALALVGWLGLLGGASLEFAPALAARALLSAILAAAAGFLTALALSWLVFTRPDASVGFNGLIGGLVAVSAPCGLVSPLAAAVIGLLGGVAVIIAIQLHDNSWIDDPAGVIAVHGACGSVGTIALGLFAQAEFSPPHINTPSGLFFGGGPDLLVHQLVGLLGLIVPAVILSLLLFFILRATGSLRASPEAEIAGLDLAELATDAYPDFQATVHPIPSLDSLKPAPKRPPTSPPSSARR